MRGGAPNGVIGDRDFAHRKGDVFSTAKGWRKAKSSEAVSAVQDAAPARVLSGPTTELAGARAYVTMHVNAK